MPNSVPNKQPSAAPGSQQKAVAPSIMSMESLPAPIMPSTGTELIVPPISAPSIAPRTIQSRDEILSAWAIAHLPSCRSRTNMPRRLATHLRVAFLVPACEGHGTAQPEMPGHLRQTVIRP
jgi:hypothetical protein